MVTKRAYPDTPVALHYRPLEEIDWRELVDADAVVIVITPVFLREINDHKDRSRGQIQQRARRVSGWLGNLRRTKKWTIRDGVCVEVEAREPELDLDLSAHGLEPTVNDDKIVACMLRDRKKNPDVPLVCITTDNTLAFKAEAVGIAVIEPPEDKRLADEPDASELDNRQLRQKLIELEKRISPSPDLSMKFTDGEAHATITLSGVEEPSDEDLDEELAAERGALELRNRFLPGVLYRAPSERAVARYLERLREWMVASKAGAVLRAHTFDVRLVLTNAGTGNAADIAIDLTFPESVFVAENRPLPDLAERPSPPEPEEAFMAIAAMKPFVLPRSPLADLRLRGYEPVRLHFDAKTPHRAQVVVDSAKHQSEIEVPTFQAWCTAGRVPKGFKISYRIHAATTPDIKENVLHVKVDVREGPARLLREVVAGQEDEDLSEMVDVPHTETSEDE